MENATKALLIAAGVLIGIIILSMLLLGYNQISNYYQQQSDNLSLKQIVELNKNSQIMMEKQYVEMKCFLL